MSTDNNQVEEMNEHRELTIKDISEILDEEPHTVRNWLKELEGYIPYERKRNNYRVFKKEGLERFKLIKYLNRDQEYTLKEIMLYLDTGGEAFKPIPKIDADSMLAEEMRKMRERLDELEQRDQERDHLLKNILGQLEKQNTYIQHSLKERDENITATMREMLEGKRLIAAAKDDNQEEPKKQGWLQRLLGK
ncbi:helix-turn-helix domain-containing protein [Priestia aryabhattai]|uniref:helix-turn-helix domain-containing protein n=1 Tax=Priestia aryabhattai TaxID=412384 RepID=UPI0018761206|nr:MerR family transcriptional regulator [Priestia aryabhattai]MBE5098448.1 MerR family transcriptional regulator [Priestia aryabhattai]